MKDLDLEQLKTLWQEQDRKLDAGLRLDAQVLRELKLDRTRGALAWTGRFAIVDVLAHVAVLVVLGNYVASRIAAGQLRFVLPGLALAGFTLWAVSTGAWVIAKLERIDYSASVLALQTQLEAMRAQSLRTTRWVLLLAPLVWTPMLIVLLDGFLGIDAYATLGATYLLANLAFGLLAIPALLWLARRFAGRVEHSPRLARFLDEVAGRGLARARAQLASLAAFQQE